MTVYHLFQFSVPVALTVGIKVLS